MQRHPEHARVREQILKYMHNETRGLHERAVANWRNVMQMVHRSEWGRVLREEELSGDVEMKKVVGRCEKLVARRKTVRSFCVRDCRCGIGK